jgi:hypothetical protein
VIVDITHPDKPVIDQIFDAGGCINDLNDVKLGITYTSQFAYLADGCNGLRIVQLTNPDSPGNAGFSPRPTPVLVATRRMPRNSPALAITEALDRDRAVDESGNQIAVFGRVGARPLNRDDAQRMYLRLATPEELALHRNPLLPVQMPAKTGEHDSRARIPWFVSDNPFDTAIYRWTPEVPPPAKLSK